VDLIQELPEKWLEGNTVVSQLSSVKSQKNRLYQIQGSTTAAKRKFRIIIIPYQKALYAYSLIKVHS
jgi:hypothetical protein